MPCCRCRYPGSRRGRYHYQRVGHLGLQKPKGVQPVVPQASQHLIKPIDADQCRGSLQALAGTSA